MKICSECKKEKIETEFHKHKSHKDGLCSKCKTCRLPIVSAYYRTERGLLAARINGKKYGQTKRGKLTKKRYRQKTKLKRQARHAIGHAIEIGRMIRVKFLRCCCCPAQAQFYHHCKGYEKEHWLDVVPVCQACDFKLHADREAKKYFTKTGEPNAIR